MRTIKPMIHYFLKDGKTEIGPLTIEQLKCRPVNKNTPVWFAGLEEWTTLEQVYELKELVNPKSLKSYPFSNSRLVKFWNRVFNKPIKNKSNQMIISKERKSLN